MPRRSTPFQRLVHQIESVLHGSTKVTESALLEDAITGDPREVDVLIEDRAGPRDVRIAVDVTEQKRKVDAPWVESRLRRTEDLRPHINQVVFVSKAGFTEAAASKAAAAGAETLTFDEAIDHDWTRFVGKAKRLMVGRTSFDVLSLFPKVACSGPGPLPAGPVEDSVPLHDSQGRPRGTMHEWIEGVLFPQLAEMADREHWRDGHVFRVDADPGEPCYLHAHGRCCQLLRIQATMVYHLKLATLDMEAGSYRSVPVAHATSDSSFGAVRLTVVEERGAPTVRGSLEIEDAEGEVETHVLNFRPPTIPPTAR